MVVNKPEIITNQIKSKPSTTILEGWFEVFVLICLCGFFQMWCCTLYPNISTLLSAVWSTLIKKFCHLLQTWAHVFSWQPFQTCHACSVFFIVLWWTLTFNMLAEACRVWCVALQFFVRFFCSFTEHCMGSGFVFRLRLVTVLNVFLLWIIFLTPGWWNCLRMPS